MGFDIIEINLAQFKFQRYVAQFFHVLDHKFNTPKNKGYLRNEDFLRNEDCLKNEGDLKNEDNLHISYLMFSSFLRLSSILTAALYCQTPG